MLRYGLIILLHMTLLLYYNLWCTAVVVVNGLVSNGGTLLRSIFFPLLTRYFKTFSWRLRHFFSIRQLICFSSPFYFLLLKNLQQISTRELWVRPERVVDTQLCNLLAVCVKWQVVEYQVHCSRSCPLIRSPTKKIGQKRCRGTRKFDSCSTAWVENTFKFWIL